MFNKPIQYRTHRLTETHRRVLLILAWLFVGWAVLRSAALSPTPSAMQPTYEQRHPQNYSRSVDTPGRVQSDLDRAAQRQDSYDPFRGVDFNFPK